MATVVTRLNDDNQYLPATDASQTDANGKAQVDHPAKTAQDFLDSIQSAITKGDVDGIVKLFHPDGWLRDILVTDITDFNSWTRDELAGAFKQHGLPKVSNLRVDMPEKAKLVPVADGLEWIQAFLTFETPKSRGRGFVRLRQEPIGQGGWLAYTFFLANWEIKGHEEYAFDRRPLGLAHGDVVGRKNWKERREAMVRFEDSDPTVVIVGAGQNGLMLGARLTALGIPTLIVEKNPRVGDNWRNRYANLVLHDPVFADHFPYISYPPQWPIFTPKDKLGNWLEMYAGAMELNVWNEATLVGESTFDEKTGQWTVTVEKKGSGKRTLHPEHLVLATGFSGRPREPDFPIDEFKGVVCHSSKHVGAEGYKGKKAVVVGCCNSGHDIAASFYEQGAAEVTMVQRSHTYVVSSEHGLPAWLNGYYEENGPPTEDADIMFTSLPVNVVEQYHIESTKGVYEKDKETLDGLEKAGFKVNRYPGGLFMKYFRDGGGYYLDVGCSKLIADGKIKIKQGVEIQKLEANGVRFKDGSFLEADIVVLALGYGSMRDTVREVISPKVADNLKTCWGIDKQGEIPTVWRQSGQPNFWLQCGNFFQARTMSKHVALQIQMAALGMVKATKDTYPEHKHIPDKRF